MKIPKKVMGLAGVIHVSFKKAPKVQGTVVAGFWSSRERKIVINSTIPRYEQLHTYIHELVHAALDDSGQHNLLTKDGQEALADLIATARMRESV